MFSADNLVELPDDSEALKAMVLSLRREHDRKNNTPKHKRSVPESNSSVRTSNSSVPTICTWRICVCKWNSIA